MRLSHCDRILIRFKFTKNSYITVIQMHVSHLLYEIQNRRGYYLVHEMTGYFEKNTCDSDVVEQLLVGRSYPIQFYSTLSRSVIKL